MANWLEYLITLQIFDLAVFNFCPALNMPFLRTKQDEGGECMSPCKRPKGSIQSELLHVTLTMATIYDEALVERVQDLLTSKPPAALSILFSPGVLSISALPSDRPCQELFNYSIYRVLRRVHGQFNGRAESLPQNSIETDCSRPTL